MSSPVRYSWIYLELNELFGFLVEKMKDMLELRDGDISVEEGDVYTIEFRDSIIIPYKRFNKFTTFLLDLGFVPMDDKVEDSVRPDGRIYRSSIYEYMNDDGVRVITVSEEELDKDKHPVYPKKIIVGKTSLINNPISGKVEEFLRILERMKIDYKHCAEPGSQVIIIRGHVVKAGASVLVVKTGECKEIEIAKYGNPKKVRIYDICDRKHESVEIGDGIRYEYENGSLYIRFFHFPA
jgi:hypothetical protein